MKTRWLNHRRVILLASVLAPLLSLVLMAVNATASARTLAELQQADNIRIKTWIEPAQEIVARQQVMLQIEVATDERFSGGTRIGNFEIKDAITMQREKFALNSGVTVIKPGRCSSGRWSFIRSAVGYLKFRLFPWHYRLQAKIAKS